MTVGELKAILNNYDENQEIVFKPQNSRYVENFSSNINTKEISNMWGSDYKALVLKSNGQCGGI